MLGNRLKNILVISALLIVPSAESAQSKKSADDMKPDTAERPHENELLSSDESFLNKAAEAGLAEIEAAKLAQKKSISSEIKDFAAQMIADHTKLNDELIALAVQKGATLPRKPTLMQQEELKTMAALEHTFDKCYVDRMAVSAHEKAVALFKESAEKSEDVDVKAFAKNKLLSLESHLEMAKILKSTFSTN